MEVRLDLSWRLVLLVIIGIMLLVSSCDGGKKENEAIKKKCDTCRTVTKGFKEVHLISVRFFVISLFEICYKKCKHCHVYLSTSFTGKENHRQQHNGSIFHLCLSHGSCICVMIELQNALLCNFFFLPSTNHKWYSTQA